MRGKQSDMTDDIISNTTYCLWVIPRTSRQVSKSGRNTEQVCVCAGACMHKCTPVPEDCILKGINDEIPN